MIWNRTNDFLPDGTQRVLCMCPTQGVFLCWFHPHKHAGCRWTAFRDSPDVYYPTPEFWMEIPDVPKSRAEVIRETKMLLREAEGAIRLATEDRDRILAELKELGEQA